jgi:hypothetical protein
MNKYGAAGRGAINPASVIAFLDTRLHTVGGKLALDWQEVSDNDKRTMRRWRRNTKGINEQAFKRFLSRHGLSYEEYVNTCQAKGLTTHL